MDVNVESNIDSKWMELYESTVNALFAYANICLCAVENKSARGERKVIVVAFRIKMHTFVWVNLNPQMRKVSLFPNLPSSRRRNELMEKFIWMCKLVKERKKYVEGRKEKFRCLLDVITAPATAVQIEHWRDIIVC